MAGRSASRIDETRVRSGLANVTSRTVTDIRRARVPLRPGLRCASCHAATGRCIPRPRRLHSSRYARTRMAHASSIFRRVLTAVELKIGNCVGFAWREFGSASVRTCVRCSVGAENTIEQCRSPWLSSSDSFIVDEEKMVLARTTARVITVLRRALRADCAT